MTLKSFCSLLLFILSLQSLGSVMSKRCEVMHEKRKRYFQLQNKALALSQKASSLVQRTPEEKKTLYAKMKLLELNLKKKYLEVQSQLKDHEETMIRKGCPGLKYRGSL